MATSAETDPVVEALLTAPLAEDERCVVAVSGGIDSVVLLDAMAGLVADGRRQWDLLIGHVHHGLRGEQADQDERFVHELGLTYGIEVRVASVDTRTFSGEHRLSLETAARELRYRALRSMLKDRQGGAIVLGHSADDQAETLVLHLIRGAGLRGLGAMRPRSGDLVRPMLRVRRDVIARVAQDRGLDFRMDSSNEDDRHLRNRVRSEVMPVLAWLQPSIPEILTRTADVLRSDVDYLNLEVQRVLDSLGAHYGQGCISIQRGGWLALHPSLQIHVLREMVKRLLGDVDDIHEAHIRNLLVRARSQTVKGTGDLPRGLELVEKHERIEMRTRAISPVLTLEDREVPGPGSLDIESGRLTIELLPDIDRHELELLVGVCGPSHLICDADRLHFPLHVGSRRPGDRMRPFGAPGSRSVKDIMIDRKIARAARSRIPVIRSNGSIVWLCGVAFAHSVAISASTRHVAHMLYRPRANHPVVELPDLSQLHEP